MTGKNCSKCNSYKELDEFHNSKVGFLKKSSRCKVCISKYDKTRKDIRLKTTKSWYQKNRLKILNNIQQQRSENIDKYRTREKLYAINNREKINEKTKRRSNRQKLATPKWLTERQKFEIRKKYRTVKILNILDGHIKYSVDHIEPIFSPNACGLHVPWNLQIIDKIENSRKACRRDAP